MPRLTLAQGLSPELIETDPKYIEGLKNGDAFNTLTGKIYGKGVLECAIIRADPPRGVEFMPRGAGGGVKDFNVPINDPRMQFTTDKEGKRQKPIATKFYDFVIVLLPSREVVALSFKGAALKTAKRLNGLIKFKASKIPIFGWKYKMVPTLEQSPKGTYSVFRVDNAGLIQDGELYAFLRSSFNAIKNKEIKIEREPGSDDDVPAPGDLN